MSLEGQGSYEFGPFRLDPAQQQLFENDKPVSLTPKAFDTLRLLVENHGRLVSKEELLQEVWPDAFVEESTLAQNVFRLRKLLGDGNGQPIYIETIPKRGYRFVAPVQRGATWINIIVAAGALANLMLSVDARFPPARLPLSRCCP